MTGLGDCGRCGWPATVETRTGALCRSCAASETDLCRRQACYAPRDSSGSLDAVPFCPDHTSSYWRAYAAKLESGALTSVQAVELHALGDTQ